MSLSQKGTKVPKLKKQLSSVSVLMQKCSLDNPTRSVNMCGLLVLDRPEIDTEKLVALVNERILKFDRFRSVPVIEGKIGQGEKPKMCWKDLGAEYSSESNLLKVDADGWGDSEVKDYLDEHMPRPFQPEIPAWEIHALENMKGGKSALLVRFDHVLGDGYTAMNALLSLASTKDGAQPPTFCTIERSQKDQKRAIETTSFLTLLTKLLKMPLVLIVLLWSTPYALYVSFFRAFVPDSSTPVMPVGASKGRSASHFSKALPVDKLKVIGRAHSGAKVNDILVAILTTATFRYLKDVYKYNADKHARATAMTTINLRTSATASQLGNRSGFIFIPLDQPHVYAESPALTLRQVHRTTQKIKASPAFMLLNLMEKLRAVVIAMKGVDAIADLLSGPRYSDAYKTVRLTNVPGPQEPLFVSDAEVLTVHAFINAPHSIVAFSYNGKLTMGYTADENHVDGKKFLQYINKTYEELAAESF